MGSFWVDIHSSESLKRGSVNIYVFLVVFLSEFLHVAWNIVVKKCKDKISFTWLTVVTNTICVFPLFIVLRIIKPGPLDMEIWARAALSGLFYALYTIFLYRAYGETDLTMVYPLSRGIAPLVTLLVGGVVVGDTVTSGKAIAVLIIVTGVVIISLSTRIRSSEGVLPRMPQKPKKAWRHLSLSGIFLAIATGCITAGYHLVDRGTMSRTHPPNIIEYLFIAFMFMTAFVTIWVLFNKDRRSRVFSEWRTNKGGVIFVAVSGIVAYFLILVALQYGNVTYVTAGRSIGIVISVVTGALILKEKIKRLRIFGVLLIFLGMVGLVTMNNYG